MQTRDVVVIGASLGGIEALSTLVGQLPGGLAVAGVAHEQARAAHLCRAHAPRRDHVSGMVDGAWR